LGHPGNVFDGRGADFGLIVLEEASEELEYFSLARNVLRSDEAQRAGDGGEDFGQMMPDSPDYSQKDMPH
jgi:hypothetical protein